MFKWITLENINRMSVWEFSSTVGDETEISVNNQALVLRKANNKTTFDNSENQ